LISGVNFKFDFNEFVELPGAGAHWTISPVNRTVAILAAPTEDLAKRVTEFQVAGAGR
jgi:hypothetical protein